MQTDRQTDRQETDRQTDRQTEIPADESETEKDGTLMEGTGVAGGRKALRGN